MARRVDWSFGPGHGPVSGVVNAALSAMSVTMVADLVDRYLTPVSAWWPLGVALAAAIVAGLVAGAQFRVAVMFFRFGCWLAAGLWSSWTLSGIWWLGSAGTPWSVPSLAMWACGVLVTSLIGLGLAAVEGRDKPPAEAAETPGAEEREDRIAAAWTARLQKISSRDVTVTGVEVWPTGTGYTLAVELPADGTTIDDLKRHEKALATAANLPPGCNVEILATDEGRRTILVRIATVSALGEDHHLPEDYSAESINNGISIGIEADRTPATINLRYSCAVLIGQTDSGKSNELNDITTGIVRCTDVLLWAIDLSGNGRYPRPWIRAWTEGKAEAPAIDWVAPAADEAELLTTAAIQIINGRTAAYEARMHAEGEDKIMVAPDLPQIIIVVDEFGTLPQSVKENIETISDTGRGAGVRTVSCALEATGKYITRSIITQARVRIGMRVTDEAQLQYLFDQQWSRGRFDPAATPWKGSGRYADGPIAPVEFKGWRMEPRRIERASIAVGPLRPDLDEISVALANTVEFKSRDGRGGWLTETVENVYTGRWERTLSTIFPNGNGTPPQSAAPRGQNNPEQGEAAADLSGALSGMNDALARARAVADSIPEPPQADPAEKVDDTDGTGLPPLPEEPDFGVVESWLEPIPGGGQRPQPRIRVRQLVLDARVDGTGPGLVYRTLRQEGYPTAYQTVVGWMKDDLAAGVLAQPGGDKTPYYPGPKIGDPYRADH